jgi:DNA-binding Lrp family transcriptional regulator
VLGNRLEQQILEIFDRDFSLLLSINQISKKLKKSYPHINAKVSNLIKEGVLSKANVGRSYLCSLNLGNEKSIALLMLDGAKRKEKTFSKIKNISLFLEEITRIKTDFSIHTIALSEDSLIFVMDHLYDQEAIKNMYREIKQFNLLFFDRQNFVEYYLGRADLLQNIVVLYSYEKYFELISTIKERLVSRKLLGKKNIALQEKNEK